MNFRPPVYSTYSTPHARVVDDSTVVGGGVGMSLTQGLSGDGVIEKMDVLGTVGSCRSQPWSLPVENQLFQN